MKKNPAEGNGENRRPKEKILASTGKKPESEKKKKEPDPDLERLKEDARRGNPEAQSELAARYAEGNGVRKNSTRARELFALAAKQGNPKGINGLGVLYNTGRGVKKDLRRAFVLFQKAADLGYRSAMTNLGDCYGWGVGVHRDEETAVQYYRKGAELGCDGAQLALGRCLLWGRGVERNKTEAAKWIRKPAGATQIEIRGVPATERFGEASDRRPGGLIRAHVSRHITTNSFSTLTQNQKATMKEENKLQECGTAIIDTDRIDRIRLSVRPREPRRTEREDRPSRFAGPLSHLS